MTPLEQEILLNLIDSFIDDSLVSEVLECVQGGKEATVFRCRAAPETGDSFYAVKVYRPMERRNFKNDSMYQNGRVILNGRSRRAYEGKTDFGRKVQYGRWVNAEYETQRMLFDAGVDVPRPVACNGSAILMEWLGTEDAAAPQLRRAQFGPNAAVYLFKSILGNVELMLRNNVIHGDLSPFNILFHEGGIRIIDFPQAIDARTNHNAFPLLLRDLEHVYEFFQPHGVRADPLRIAQSLWARYLRAEL